MGRGRHLTWNDRLQIERYLRDGLSVAETAKRVHVCRGTIYNELKRGSFEHLNGKTWEIEKRYSPDMAQQRCDELKQNHGPQLKIGRDRAYASEIERTIIDRKYSPAAALADIHRRGLLFSTTICKNTIYNYIRKGVFLNLTMADLPNKGQYKKRKYAHVKSSRATAGTSIEKRPDITDRTAFGHWEMDTVIGKQRTKPILLVLSERKTRYELICKLPDKSSRSVICCMDKLERKYGKHFSDIFKSITVDNGTEFSNHTELERSVRSNSNRTTLYYCHPYSAYERGTNENTNKIIRRFCPKGTDFRRVPPGYIRAVETWINDLPRKVLGYKSAAELFQHELDCINAV